MSMALTLLHETPVYTSYYQTTALTAPRACCPPPSVPALMKNDFSSTIGSKDSQIYKKSLPTHCLLINF